MIGKDAKETNACNSKRKALGQRPSRPLLLLLTLVLLAGISWQGCGTPPVTEPGSSCSNALDCPGSMACVSGKCINQSVTPTDAGQEVVGEVTTETPKETTKEVPAETSDAGQELTPELPPETLEEQPSGECKAGDTKECDGGCGKGKQECTGGKWGLCWPEKKTRSCYDGPQGTEGKGECKAGSQNCEAKEGKVAWTDCKGQTKPVKEVCGDGKDNDCNGEADEKAAGCTCKPGDTQACGTSEGACKEGKQTCTTKSEWGPCQGEVKGSTESCNGIDDDCDGKTDEDFSTKDQPCEVGKGACKAKGVNVCDSTGGGVVCDAKPGQPQTEICNNIDDDCDGSIDETLKRECYSATAGCTKNTTGTYSCKGTCQAGSEICTAGKWSSCQGETTPKTEICRDGKDNDCDGRADEICGSTPLWLIAKGSNGSIIKQQTSNVKASLQRAKTGIYKLGYNNSVSCKSYPIFLTAHTFVNKPVSYNCDGDTFTLRMGEFNTIRGTHGDNDFTAVVPPRATGEVWGLIDNGTCQSRSPYTCKHTFSYGGATIYRVKTGVYEIRHSACNSRTGRPMFVNIKKDAIVGYASIALSTTSVCRVSTFDLYGKPANYNFSYWLPSPSRYAWAYVSTTSGIVGNNNFGDQLAKWTGQRNTRYPQRFDISYPGYANPSAILVTPQSSGPTSAVAGYTSAVKQGVSITTSAVAGISTKGRPVNFSVMFIQ